MRFQNKVVLITGAGSGIGAATAIEFAKEGAKVSIIDKHEENLNKTAELCKGHSETLLIVADVSQSENIRTIIEKTIDKFAKLDVLVNCAGFQKCGSIIGGDILQAYDEVMKTNLRAIIDLTTLAAPHLIASKGNIVNVSSVCSKIAPFITMIPYFVSKAALDQFTKGAAVELGSYGVRVNSVNPGTVKTNFMENAGQDESLWELGRKASLFQRLGEPIEIADIILFLASEKAKSITGSFCVSDNGLMLMDKKF